MRQVIRQDKHSCGDQIRATRRRLERKLRRLRAPRRPIAQLTPRTHNIVALVSCSLLQTRTRTFAEDEARVRWSERHRSDRPHRLSIAPQSAENRRRGRHLPGDFEDLNPVICPAPFASRVRPDRSRNRIRKARQLWPRRGACVRHVPPPSPPPDPGHPAGLEVACPGVGSCARAHTTAGENAAAALAGS